MTDKRSTTEPDRLRFRKHQRIRKGVEFQVVYQSKLYAADGILVVNAYRRPEEVSDKRIGRSLSRLGLAVSKKAGNAPVRNKWKRHIRQAFRLCQHQIPDGWDFVFRPKKGSQLDGKAIAKSVPKLIQKVIRKAKQTAKPNQERKFKKDRTVKGESNEA